MSNTNRRCAFFKKLLKSIIKILVIVIVIILIVLSIALTMGASLATIVPIVGLTIGQLLIVGIAALAVCFIISPEGASEGLKKAFDGVSGAISGIISGATGVVVDGVKSLADELNLGSWLLLLGGGFLGYKLLTKDDSKIVMQVENRERANGI